MIRFILIVLLFLVSLLCVFKAFTYHLWITAILVSEFPWIFLIITGGLLVLGIAPQKFQLIGNVLAAMALLLFCYPIISASMVSRSLHENLKMNFGSVDEKDLKSTPFSFSQMITGIGSKQVTYQTFVYKSFDNLDLTLDFYPSQLKGKKPCVIVIHGGSWASGDSQQLPELNSELAKKGYHVASINYRLAPKYQSPAPKEDIQDVLKYLRIHSEEFQIDTNRFVLIGRSAGAQIAMISAYTSNDPGIKGVVSFYGPADMVWGYSLPSNPLIMNSRKVMEDYLGGTYEQVPQNYVASSPAHAVSNSAVPTLMIHGKNDVLVAYEHEIRLSKKLDEHQIPHYLLSLPWATHGTDYTLNGPGGQLSTYAVEYFLKSVTTK